jgi:hypothetical protein
MADFAQCRLKRSDAAGLPGSIVQLIRGLKVGGADDLCAIVETTGAGRRCPEYTENDARLPTAAANVSRPGGRGAFRCGYPVERAHTYVWTDLTKRASLSEPLTVVDALPDR